MQKFSQNWPRTKYFGWFLIVLALPTPTLADPQLGDLVVALPKIFLVGIYLLSKKYFWWTTLAAVVSWVFAIFFQRDILWFMPESYPKRRFNPSTHGALTALVIGMLAVLAIGAVTVAPAAHEIEAQIENTTQDQLQTPSKPKQPALLETKYFNPMGGVWPAQSMELFSVPNLNAQDTFDVALDNRLGESAAYIKLCPIKQSCLRQAFLAKGSTLTMRNIPQTTSFLELRYIELAAPDGIRVAKSHPFDAWQALPTFVLPNRPGEPLRTRDALHSDAPYPAVFTQIARAEF